jgi:hypothetical protein
MAGKRPNDQLALRLAQRKRRLPGGPRRKVHITLPVAVAKRLDRLVADRDVASASVLVCQWIEREPMRSTEPAPSRYGQGGADTPDEPA